MARTWNRLTANAVRAARNGLHADGGNLYLQVGKGRSWLFIYGRNGARREMGLGTVHSVPLAMARELAAQCREQLARGLDPVDARKAAGLADKAARARLMTFKECALEFHAANLTRWKNQKHRDEWISTLRRYAFPIIGHLSVDVIDGGHVHRVLAPLVAAKPVTAARLRGRLEMVLDFAKASGRRSGENAASNNIIAHMLPMQSEKANVAHQAALPFAKLPALMTALRATEGRAARLLELIILTAMRTDAARVARFDEFDLPAATWTIPASRMKRLQHDHRVPLGARAVALVRELRAQTNGDLLFAGAHGDDRPLGRNEAGKVLAKLLTAIKHDAHAVVHGFRASFKTWAHEARNCYPTEVIEAALAHRIRGSIARAYLRTDFFDKRKPLMVDWESHCLGANVLDFKQRA